MKIIRFLTAGESHGKSLTMIIEGFPAGVKVDEDYINLQLKRRKWGYGRSRRAEREEDRIEISSGIKNGTTTGSPLCLKLENQFRVDERDAQPITLPRPGHADLPGAIKYGHHDIRSVSERASARETAIRVAGGAVARLLLNEFGISVMSHVVQIGTVKSPYSALDLKRIKKELSGEEGSLEFIGEMADSSPVRCLCSSYSRKMIKLISEAENAGDTLGGAFEVIAVGLPPGLGSYVHWDRKLDGKIARAFMSIPAIKGVEIGLGFAAACMRGSAVQDQIYYKNKEKLHSSPGSSSDRSMEKEEERSSENSYSPFIEMRFFRKTNNAGGIEGGVTNGEPVVVRAAMKPIPTLSKPLASVDIITRKAAPAHRERHDICAVAAASVVGEAVLSLVLADEMCRKYGGDSIGEMLSNFRKV